MYYVGIDWADEKHAVAVLNDDATRLATFSISHNRHGMSLLESKLDEISTNREDFACIIETRNGLLVEFLLRAGFPVYPINPKLATARRKASGAKTDPLDAIILANIGRSDLRELRQLVPNSEVVEKLQALTRAQLKLISEQTSWSNRLRSSLKKYFPLALDFFSSVAGPVSLAFLQQFPTLDLARNAELEEIEALLRKHRYPYSSRKAKDIFDQLREEQLIASPETVMTESLWAKGCVEHLILLHKQVEQYQKLINELFMQHPVSDIILSLPGMGERLAPYLLAEWGDSPGRYESVNVIQALAGTSPVLYQSGKYRIAKQRKSCVKQLRRTLHLFAFQTISRVPWAKEYYYKKRQEGKGHHESLRALANIWVRIIYAMLTKQEKYSEPKFLQAKTQQALVA